MKIYLLILISIDVGQDGKLAPAFATQAVMKNSCKVVGSVLIRIKGEVDHGVYKVGPLNYISKNVDQHPINLGPKQ